MNKMNFKTFLELLPNSEDYFKTTFEKINSEKEIEEKVSRETENLEGYNETYMRIAKEIIENKKRERMAESLECFADALGLEISSIYSSDYKKVDFKIKEFDNNISLDESDSDEIYKELDKIFTNIFNKGKLTFPNLLTNRFFDNYLLKPLSDVLYIYEFRREAVENLTFENVITLILREYFKNFISEIRFYSV